MKGIFNFQICTINPLFPEQGPNPTMRGRFQRASPSLQHLAYIPYLRSPTHYHFIVCTPVPVSLDPAALGILYIYSFLSPWFSPPHLIAPSSNEHGYSTLCNTRLKFCLFLLFSSSFLLVFRIQSSTAKQSGGGVSSGSFAARAQSAADRAAPSAPKKN